MNIDKERVGRRFNRHAATYDRHARVQQMMADRLLEVLAAEGLEARTILELGCGTGYLTSGLAKQFPEANITAVDLATNMIEATRQRLGTDRLEGIVGDAETADLGGRHFDLIVSNATLQWFAEPRASIATFAAMLEPGGLMLHETFGPETFKELFASFKSLEGEKGRVHQSRGLVLLPGAEWSRYLRDCGLSEVRTTSSRLVAEYASCRACLGELRGTGAAYGAGESHGMAFLSEVMRRYDRDYPVGLGVYATFEVLELGGRRSG